MQGKMRLYDLKSVFLCALFSTGVADFNCVCNYHVELAVHHLDDYRSSLFGYIYEFDCIPEAPNVKTSGGWVAVMFERKLGFVESDSNVLLQQCPGNIPAKDMYITTTTATTMLIQTTTTDPTTTTTPPATTTTTTTTATPTTTTTHNPTTITTHIPIPTTTRTTTFMPVPTTPADPCSPSPCVRGSCFIGSGNNPTFFCLCPTRYTGLHCGTDITTTTATTMLIQTTTTVPTTTTTTPAPTTTTTTTATSTTTTTHNPTKITTHIPIPTTTRTTTFMPGGDICLACTDSPMTRECLYTMTCETHESCYADTFDNPNGDIIFNMGCRDSQLCGSSGKREVVNRSSGNTLLCTQCCTGNMCNAALCGQTGLPSVGPVCFKCDQASTPSSCNQITLCGRDEVCIVEKIIGSLTHATLYKSGCYHKTQCDKHAHNLSLVGRKRYDNTVMSGNDLQIQCCDSNLCNHGNARTISGRALATGAVAPAHS